MKARGRDAEVGDERVAILVEEDVVRLDVAVHDPAPVRVVERDGDLRGIPRRERGTADGPIAHDDVGQRAAGEVRHDEEHDVADLAVVDDRADVRVRQLRRRLRFAPEALPHLRRRARGAGAAP